MQLNLWSGNFNANSGSAVYGAVYAPSSTVTFNGGSTLNGSITASKLNMNSSSVIYSLKPPPNPNSDCERTGRASFLLIHLENSFLDPETDVTRYACLPRYRLGRNINIRFPTNSGEKAHTALLVRFEFSTPVPPNPRGIFEKRTPLMVNGIKAFEIISR